MALLHLVRYRSSDRLSPRAAATLVLLASTLAGCDGTVPRDPRLIPDSLLRDSLGLGEEDRVHTVRLSGESDVERARPPTVGIEPADWVQFATADGRIHTVTFELDSLGTAASDFLRSTGQVASPPMVERDARFVVDFGGAPPGRYPYRVEGSGSPGWGVVVVRAGGG